MHQKPNILLITSDQQHYSMLGSVNPRIQTPNLDRLAGQGIRFDRAYCPNPTCTPSRASIITGMYPSQHGAWSLGTKLREDIPTLPGILGQNGYRTALVGKAHLQPTEGTVEFPSIETKELFQDFAFWKNYREAFYGFEHIELQRGHTAEPWVGSHYAMWMEEKGLKNWRDFFFAPGGNRHWQEMGSWEIPEEFHYNTWITERSNALLEEYKEREQPFFLWASFLDPHYPQLVPAPWDRMYHPDDMEIPAFDMAEHKKSPPYFEELFERGHDFSAYRETGFGIHGLHHHDYNLPELKQQLAYAYGMVSFMDHAIGKILDRLEALGLAENTVVVFTTDHGDLFGQHGMRHKCIAHYEDLLKIPMIVRYPGHVARGSVSQALQSLVDFAPTVLSCCGVDAPRVMTGVDQSAVWSGAAAWARKHVIIENRHEPTTMNMRTYVDERYKLTVHCGREYGEIYDLQADPQEHHNLWDEPECAALKSELLLRYATAELLKEPMWMPRVAGA